MAMSIYKEKILRGILIEGNTLQKYLCLLVKKDIREK